jgi:hypothetical protein
VDCIFNRINSFPLGNSCIIYTVSTGGTWGLNKTVGWAWDITNFVWWVGIGHAGTLISAVLYYSVSDGEWRLTVLQKQTIFLSYSSGFISNYTHGSSMVALGFTIPINLDLYG